MSSTRAVVLPLRLLGLINGRFEVFNPQSPGAPQVDCFDIVSYTWGDPTTKYNCGIDGVNWDVTIDHMRIEEIKRLMGKGEPEVLKFMWVDCVCINQTDEDEKDAEIPRMYHYYRSARKCHILIGMEKVWDPQAIVDNLKFVDHILSSMVGASLASEAKLTPNATHRLSMWADQHPWAFPMDKSSVRSAAIDMGVLNCYSTCINYVSSLWDSLYFTRVWTFQEMLLGKNITMWGINDQSISCIGELDIWMDLATDSQDKAYKLQSWIDTCRVLNTASVNAILRIIEDDKLLLDALQLQVNGIRCARTDIINGGPRWWYENYKGISNIFSAVSIQPRKCGRRADIFKGLLGVFNGLFTEEEIKRKLDTDDIETLSFAFFKQLSIKTGDAWTRLAISSGERNQWDWIPVVANVSKPLSTDCFAGVVRLGRLKKNGCQAKAIAMTGIIGAPREYMKIQLREGNNDFQFAFTGCNCGKTVKTGRFSSKPIPTYDQPTNVVTDETGRTLVQCATILGFIMDPDYDVVDYRRKLLRRLQPDWYRTDPSAKPKGWIDRCVNGTSWENPHEVDFRVHNMSMNYRMNDIKSCGSRLHNGSTENLSCEVRVNCGCAIVAPFSLIFEAITAVAGCSLGDTTAAVDTDRIVLHDGLGLVQVGDVGKAFSLVAFGGDDDAHRAYSHSCRSTRQGRGVVAKRPWPRGRALVKEEFRHGFWDGLRDYGFVPTGGSGNLLICRNHPMGKYKIIGVCIDEQIDNKKGERSVTIR
jgi:Heterokaryon incompatibility protein (HET)